MSMSTVLIIYIKEFIYIMQIFYSASTMFYIFGPICYTHATYMYLS